MQRDAGAAGLHAERVELDAHAGERPVVGPAVDSAFEANRMLGGPNYKFPVRPQQIVTMRFKTTDAVPAVKPLTEWNELMPEKKREALRRYLPDVKGHLPAGGQ